MKIKRSDIRDMPNPIIQLAFKCRFIRGFRKKAILCCGFVWLISLFFWPLPVPMRNVFVVSIMVLVLLVGLSVDLAIGLYKFLNGGTEAHMDNLDALTYHFGEQIVFATEEGALKTIRRRLEFRAHSILALLAQKRDADADSAIEDFKEMHAAAAAFYESVDPYDVYARRFGFEGR